MSALPKQVKAKIELANKLASEYHASLKGGDAPTGDATPPGDGAPPATGEQAAAAPAPSPAPSPDAAAVAQIPQAEWEQKYKVLQGKYNAEVPRLQAQTRDQAKKLDELSDQLISTQRLLASFAEQRNAPAASQQGTPPASTKLIKDEEEREFGSDLIDVMRRVAREEQASLMPEIDRRVAPVAQRANQAVQNTEQLGAKQKEADQQAVLDLLAREVPNFVTVNRDPEFHAWLDEVDPFAGVQRGVLLTQAHQAHDGPRVVAFFTGFLKEHAAVTPTPAPVAATAPKAPQRQLTQLVAPGTPKTGAAGTQDGSGKRVWSRAEISKFYDDASAGRLKMTPEQRKATERDIFAAQNEGRVR